MAVIGAVADFAAAVICTGALCGLPGTGKQMVTPTIAAAQPDGGGVGVGVGLGVGVGVEPGVTVTVRDDLKTAPLESHACTTTLRAPAVTGRLTSRLAADVRKAEELSM